MRRRKFKGWFHYSHWQPCLRSVLPKSSVPLCVFFLWAKGLNAKNIHNEMFPVYGGKGLSRKSVHSWVQKLPPWWRTFRWWRRGWNGGVEVAETAVKRLLCCALLCTGKAMGQVYQSSWTICREIKVFSRFEYHIFYVLYPFVSYLLTLPRRHQTLRKLTFCDGYWTETPTGHGPSFYYGRLWSKTDFNSF
jgi:hypothetical protein